MLQTDKAKLKDSHKSLCTSEAFDLFIEVDPAESVIKDRNSIMVTISAPQSKRKAECSKVVHAITKGDDEQTNRISKDSSTKS